MKTTFDYQHGLSIEDIKHVDSIFTESPSNKTTDKYSFIQTRTLLETLIDNKWLPIKAGQQGAKADNYGFQKHMIVFRHPEFMPTKQGDLIPEIVVTNSHNGSSSFIIHAGLFRVACLNGLIIADSTFAAVRIRHIGYTANKVIDAVGQVVDAVPTIMGKVENWKTLQLNPEHQQEFALNAALLRWEKEHLPFAPSVLLHTRRQADTGSDLFSVYNRVQENLTKGMRVRSNYRITSSRPVSSITNNININKALWSLADQTAIQLAA